AGCPFARLAAELFRTRPGRSNPIGAAHVREVTPHRRERACMQVVLGERSMDAVVRNDRVVIAVERLTHRGLDGDARLAAGDDEGADAIAAQQDLELRVRERAGTMITNHLLAVAWRNFKSRRCVPSRAVRGCRGPRMNDEASGAPRMAGQVLD